MSKAKSSGFCRCCPCCDPAPSQDKEKFIIEAYQPEVPTKKRFGYPQQGLEQPSSSSKQVSLVTSQPTSGPAHSHAPVVTSQPTGLGQKLRLRGHHQRPESVPFAKEVQPGQMTPGSSLTPTPATTPVSGPSTHMSAPSLTSESTALSTAAPTSLSSPADASLELNLYFDSHRESLCVQIHRGLYFPQKQGFKSVNSFVTAFLIPSHMQTLKTRLISNSRSPAFDQVLEFSGLSLVEYKEQTLILQVFYRHSDDDADTCIATCCTKKLQDFNLMESNQLTMRIDAGRKDILELTQSEQVSLNEELQELFRSGMEQSPNSELLFTVYYNSQLQKLSIHLERIVNLPTKLPVESSNPFVQIYLLSRKLKARDIYTSHTAIQTHQPSFDCMATFSDVSMKDLGSQEVVFRIYLNGELHFLGGVVHSLHSMNLYGSTVTAEILTFPEDDSLKDNLQGDLLLSLCYQPEGKKIVITILEMKMRKPYSTQDSSSSERVSKWKTSTKKGSTNPVYRESRELHLDELGMQQVELNVTVMNSDHFGRHHEIGRVKFGEDVSEYRTGQNQWNKSLGDPNTPVTAWHPIFPSPSVPQSRLHMPGRRSRSRSRSPVYKLKQGFGLQV